MTIEIPRIADKGVNGVKVFACGGGEYDKKKNKTGNFMKGL